MAAFDVDRIAILGAGAIGGLLAAQLAHAGEPVVLWGRDPALSAIAAHGLTLTGALAFCQDVETAAGLLPRAGLYLVATKTPANRELAQRMEREILPESLVLVCQNGLDPEREFAERLGTNRVYRAIMHLGARRLSPAEVEVSFLGRPTVIGGPDVEVARAIARRLDRAGHPAEAVQDLRTHAWEKLILNAVTNPLCALGGWTIDEVMRDARFEPLLREAIAVARADGIDLGPEFAERARRLSVGAGAHRGSMWEDVRRGRPTEVEEMNGRIVERGEALGVPTPTHRRLIHDLRALPHPGSC